MFPIEVHEIANEGVVCIEAEYEVRAVWAEHKIPGLAYAFIDRPEPSRKIVYSDDTGTCESIAELAHEADVLIHESSYNDELVDRVHEDGYSIPSQTAKIARRANVRKLFLTHIDPIRNKDLTLLLKHAKKVFPKTWFAEDLMTVEVPLSCLSIE